MCNCTQLDEQTVSTLKESWLIKDTVLVSEEKLQLRYEKALEYIETHRLYGWYDLDACFIQELDSLRDKRETFFVVQEPLDPRNNEFLKSENLMKKWSCEVYEESFDSLWVPKSPSIMTYSDKNQLLYKQASSLFVKVTEWQTEHSDSLRSISQKILHSLNTDTTKNYYAIFEPPTGSTLTAYTIYYFNPYEEDNLFKSDPGYIFSRAVSATEVFFMFNEKDEIDDVWMSNWIR